jgi:co-chaperonin GroES (HSP10)
VKLKPASNYILVKSDPAEKVSEGGIHLLGYQADGKAAPVRYGTVLAVGPGRWYGNTRVPVTVKPGDYIAFSPIFSGMEKKKGGATVLGKDEVLMRDDDALCVLREA